MITEIDIYTGQDPNELQQLLLINCITFRRRNPRWFIAWRCFDDLLTNGEGLSKAVRQQLAIGLSVITQANNPDAMFYDAINA